MVKEMKNVSDRLISRLSTNFFFPEGKKKISESQDMWVDTSKMEKQKEKKKNIERKKKGTEYPISKNCEVTMKGITCVWWEYQKRTTTTKNNRKKKYMKL